MRALWNATEKDLRRHVRDPYALLLWLCIPLMIGGLISMVVGGSSNVPPKAHVLVANEDESPLGTLLRRAIGGGQSGQFLQLEEVGREEGRARIGRGEASALVVIPKGFAEAVLREQPTTILLVTNPAQQILPKIVEEGLEIAADAVFYTHRIAGPQLTQIAEQVSRDQPAWSSSDAAKVSVAMYGIVERLEKYAFPPAIAVETSVDRKPGREPVNLAKLFFPGVVLMALIFMAGGLSGDLWCERDQGTLRRAACAPSAIATFLAGKLLASGIVIAISMLIVLVIGSLFHRLPLSNLPLALIWSTASGCLFLLMFVLLQLYATSPRAGEILITSLNMPLLFLGGSFFPFEIMPRWMAAIGHWTPNGWAGAHLKDILLDREDAASLAIALAVLLVVGGILFVLGERRLRRSFVRG